jgi:hypothetical protein
LRNGIGWSDIINLFLVQRLAFFSRVFFKAILTFVLHPDGNFLAPIDFSRFTLLLPFFLELL